MRSLLACIFALFVLSPLPLNAADESDAPVFEFARAIAVTTARAKTGDLDGVKFISLGKHADGEIVVTGIALAHGHDAPRGFGAGALAIAHVHLRWMRQVPELADFADASNGTTIRLVVDADGIGIYQLGLLEGLPAYRSVTGEAPGEWVRVAE